MLIEMNTHVYLVLYLFRLLLDMLATRRLSDGQKDLEILLLRHQLRILQRRQAQVRRLRISVWEKGVLAVLATQFRSLTTGTGKQLEEALLIFKPDTVLRWHRELVRRKWTFQQEKRVGRPSVAVEVEELILQLAIENPRWGYSKIQGELLKLGYNVSRSSVRNVLKRRRIPTSPQRKKQDSNWHSFLGHYAGQMMACDFFTVETIRLQTLYALFFIELRTRRGYLAGCTAHPTSAWVSQQARNLVWDLQDMRDEDLPTPVGFLIHDRDAKFTAPFNTVFTAEGIETVLTPYRSPKANAFAERRVRTVREECLDRLLIVSEGHLRRVLLQYTEYYNRRRPHQGIGQCIPVPPVPLSETRATRPASRDPVHRRDVLGGIIHDYYWADSHAA